MSLRRLSSAFLGSSDAISAEAEVDEQLRSLYPELSVLEKRCDISLKENNFVQALKSPGKPPQVTTNSNFIIHYERSPEAVVEQLPPEYFTKEFNPVVGHLEEISSWGDGDITERFMQKIEDTDTDKDVIVGHLTEMIDSNYDELMNCMTKIQEVDLHLVQAGLQIAYGRKRISAAQSVYRNGPMKIVANSVKKAKLENILETIRGLKALKDVHKAMISKINTGDLGDAAELAKCVLECLKEQSFDQFVSMKNIGGSMQKSIYNIRRKADKALKRICCRKFTSLEYEGVIKAYLVLDHVEQTFKMKNVDPSYAEDGFYFDAAGCIEGLAQRINRFQLEDIEACLHGAIVEYIYLGQQKKQRSAVEMALPGVMYSNGTVDIGDLDEIPLNVLLRKLSAEQLPLCVVRSCSFLADIVHTHYLISQWHLSPFDEKNHNVAYLHRSTTRANERKINDSGDDNDHIAGSSLTRTDGNDTEEEDDEDDEIELFQNEPVSAPSHNGKAMRKSLSGFLTDAEGNVVEDQNRSFSGRFQNVKLLIASQSLAQSRGILWEELMRGLINMLRATHFSSEVKLDDFVSMMWALRVMILLGKEYCGSESKALVICMKEKSEEFFRNFHLETFQVIRMMIEAEMWGNIPLQINGNGGILHLMKQTYNIKQMEESNSRRKSLAQRNSISASHLARSGDTDLADGETRPRNGSIQSGPEGFVLSVDDDSVLQNFGVSGNPFKFILQRDEDLDELSQSAPESPHSNNNSPVRQGQLQMPSYLVNSAGGWSAFDAILPESPVGKRSKDNDQTSYVITQTAFNGLAKSLSKYMHIMSMIPTASSEIFDNLCQLFDYYLCSVFFGFVPADERFKFLQTPNKMTSPAPDHSRDYEVCIGATTRYHVTF